MPRFTLNMNIFPSVSMKTPKMCVKTLRTGLIFQNNRFKGHMPRFSSKLNVFPSISLETLKMCVQTLRTGLIFPR